MLSHLVTLFFRDGLSQKCFLQEDQEAAAMKKFNMPSRPGICLPLQEVSMKRPGLDSCNGCNEVMSSPDLNP